MGTENKLKMDQMSCCVACLGEVAEIDGINVFTDDHINIYKNLLHDQVSLRPRLLSLSFKISR